MNYRPTALYHRFLPAGLLAAVLLATLGAAPVARAEEGAAGADAATNVVKQVPKPQWHGTISAGATLTRGNSKNTLATAGLTAKRSWTNNEVLFDANAGYGETTTTVNGTKVDTTTESYVNGDGQWNHLFTEKLYAGLKIRGEHDDVAALAYRLTVSPLAGYYFIKKPNSELAAEIGPSYVREKFFDTPVDDYIGLRLAERGRHTFAGGSKIWESVECIPQVDDFSNYLITAEAGVAAPLSKVLNLEFRVQDTYKSQPAPGKLKNDLKLIASVAYTF